MLAEEAMAPNAIVVSAGGPVRRDVPLPHDPIIVIAADGGLVEATRLGLAVDLLVGDLDSAPAEAVAGFEAGGGRVDRYPVDKDASDLELALDAAVAAGADAVLVLGGDRGRLDHLLGGGLLLGSPKYAGVTVDAVLGGALLHVIRTERHLRGEPGETVSLFALGSPASGVRTEGLRWQLEDDTLNAGSTLGLSNEFARPDATVRVRDGVVLAIRPGTDSP
jgi:thiamine pyrophosphokinase